jgi:hypothetical protein
MASVFRSFNPRKELLRKIKKQFRQLPGTHRRAYLQTCSDGERNAIAEAFGVPLEPPTPAVTISYPDER